MIYDFNDLEAMLRNGASDAEIAEAFSENLNLARAAEEKRKAEEEKKAAEEAAKAEADKKHKEDALYLATEAATALNALLIHEGVLREGEACFSPEDLLDSISDARKETANIRSLIDSLADLLGFVADAPQSSHKRTCHKNSPCKCEEPTEVKVKVSKDLSDEDIFNELFNKLFK